MDEVQAHRWHRLQSLRAIMCDLHLRTSFISFFSCNCSIQSFLPLPLSRLQQFSPSLSFVSSASMLHRTSSSLPSPFSPHTPSSASRDASAFTPPSPLVVISRRARLYASEPPRGPSRWLLLPLLPPGAPMPPAAHDRKVTATDAPGRGRRQRKKRAVGAPQVNSASGSGVEEEKDQSCTCHHISPLHHSRALCSHAAAVSVVASPLLSRLVPPLRSAASSPLRATLVTRDCTTLRPEDRRGAIADITLPEFVAQATLEREWSDAHPGEVEAELIEADPFSVDREEGEEGEERGASSGVATAATVTQTKCTAAACASASVRHSQKRRKVSSQQAPMSSTERYRASMLNQLYTFRSTDERL